ncbi:MAG: hypothetical protein Ta2D_13100 [Rickettsiales bacterium]|nr:MAG: hypothetical protein Ta2D_13100 [Rickettsiales bacterium]
MKKRILLLTKSDKNKGYCLAGIDLDTNKFVRLVGDKNGAEIKKEKCKLLNNTEIEPLDVLNIDIIEQCPLLLQPENCLLSENNIFEKIEKYSIDDLQKLLNKIHCDNILSKKR